MDKKTMAQLITDIFVYMDDLVVKLCDGSMLKMSKTVFYATGGWNIFDYLKPVALSLTIIYFIIECNRRWAIEGNDITIKAFGAPFFKLALAAGIISEIDNITKKLIDNINAFINAAIGWAGSPTAINYNDYNNNGPIGTQIMDNSTSIGFLLGALLMFFLFIGFILGLIIKLAFLYKAFCYKIEFYFRMAYTSIACADIYSGTNSQAVRWLKNCFGFGLYGMAFVLLPKVVSAFAKTEVTNGIDPLTSGGDVSIMTMLSGIGFMMLIPVISFGMLGTIKQVTKEVMG